MRHWRGAAHPDLVPSEVRSQFLSKDLCERPLGKARATRANPPPPNNPHKIPAPGGSAEDPVRSHGRALRMTPHQHSLGCRRSKPRAESRHWPAPPQPILCA